MIVRRIDEPQLAQVSYLIGCAAAGVAIVVDPTRDVERYVRLAEADGLRIANVAETHIHADFLSGARDLAARTGATLHLSAEGGPEWAYGRSGDTPIADLRDGDMIDVGQVRVEAIHTPGHTPEHLTFLITDGAAASEPIAAVTGDFLFVGDVGRPDLLERAVRISGTMDAAARALFGSLQAFARRPDWLQVWPGHGAGSACGKGISAVPHSTLGYERRFNWAFQTAGEDDFVRQVLEGQPDPPPYFARMKRLNQQGPPPSPGTRRRPPVLGVSDLEAQTGAGSFLVDVRSASDFALGHVPGSLNLPFGESFLTWAGWLLPYDADLSLVVGDELDTIDATVRCLSLIGLDRVIGAFDHGVLDAWASAGKPVGTIPQITVMDLQASMAHGGLTVVDVRDNAERRAGHIAGALHVPLTELVSGDDAIPRSRPVAVHCASGLRASIAASLLRRRGFPHVVSVPGGMDEWIRAGLPVEGA